MIDVRVHSTLRTRIDPKPLMEAARAALHARLKRASVAIAVIGDRRMRAINRAALGHDYVTDVLSFDHGDTPEGRMIELLICAPHALRQARRHGVPPGQELARYVVHGCLHCAGYDDHDEADRKRMWAAQEKVLRRQFGKAYVPQPG
jgi:probable rRNA maturation factor